MDANEKIMQQLKELKEQKMAIQQELDETENALTPLFVGMAPLFGLFQKFQQKNDKRTNDK